jgi:hypothetical protein
MKILAWSRKCIALAALGDARLQRKLGGARGAVEAADRVDDRTHKSVFDDLACYEHAEIDRPRSGGEQRLPIYIRGEFASLDRRVEHRCELGHSLLEVVLDVIGLASKFGRYSQDRWSRRGFECLNQLAKHRGEIISEAGAEIRNHLLAGTRGPRVDNCVPPVRKPPVERGALDTGSLRDRGKGAGVDAAFKDEVKNRLLNSRGHIRRSTARPPP